MANTIRDLTGQRFGKLLVLEITGERKNRQVVWRCLCDCGNISCVVSGNLVGGFTKSCGCNNVRDFTDVRFGRLVAICPTDKRVCNRSIVWECLCDCGNICYVDTCSLSSGNTKSCGCIKKELGKAKIGQLHSRWNYELTDEDRVQGRRITGYKEWRNFIFERDEYTCQKCDCVGGNLNAHHIECYSDNPELRTELSNGITFCKDCHKDFHHLYGYNNATRDKLERYLEGYESE